jgi:elongation factor Ts
VSTTTNYRPSSDDIKRLRDESGAGMMDCRAALIKAGGDLEAAIKELRDQGLVKAAKKADRAASEGLVESYIHHNGKAGVLVELNCETDFVARNDRFKSLAKDVAQHVFAMSPQYLDREAVPEDVAAAMREEFRKEAADKPAGVIDKIVDGKMNKWYEDHVLLDQPFVRDDEKTVSDLIGEAVSALGENIRVRRFAKFSIGES